MNVKKYSLTQNAKTPKRQKFFYANTLYYRQRKVWVNVTEEVKTLTDLEIASKATMQPIETLQTKQEFHWMR